MISKMLPFYDDIMQYDLTRLNYWRAVLDAL